MSEAVSIPTERRTTSGPAPAAAAKQSRRAKPRRESNRVRRQHSHRHANPPPGARRCPPPAATRRAKADGPGPIARTGGAPAPPSRLSTSGGAPCPLPPMAPTRSRAQAGQLLLPGLHRQYPPVRQGLHRRRSAPRRRPNPFACSRRRNRFCCSRANGTAMSGPAQLSQRVAWASRTLWLAAPKLLLKFAIPIAHTVHHKA